MNYIRILMVMVAVAFGAASAVDGIAISTACRYSIDALKTPEIALMKEVNNEYIGKIVRYTIEESRVRKCDTIYSQSLATFPTFNATGTAIAFMRYDARVEGSSLIGSAKPLRLSVMDSDGSNVRDILVFDTSEVEVYIDWPAGDWVYYLTAEGVKWKGTLVKKLWKVKHNDPSSNTHVYTYSGDVWKWSISLDGTRAVTVEGVSSDGANIPHLFPPATPPTAAGFSSECMIGCQGHICPGGEWYVHFYNASHNTIRIHQWAPQSQCLSTINIKGDDIKAWAGTAILGRSMIWTRWAVNSDKWILCNMGEYRQVFRTGSNQYLVNWVDSAAIKTSNNTVHAYPEDNDNGAIRYYNTAGDFLVAGGAAHSYESVTGEWRTIGSAASRSFSDLRSVSMPERSSSQSVTAYSLTGKRVWAQGMKSNAGVYLINKNGRFLKVMDLRSR